MFLITSWFQSEDKEGDILKRSVIAKILLFTIGVLLFSFSIDMPVLGYKKLEVKEEGGYEIISYRFCGEPIKQEAFNGDSDEALDIFQKQRGIQNLQAGILFFSIASLALWWAREGKRWIYGSALLSMLLLMVDVLLIFKFH